MEIFQAEPDGRGREMRKLMGRRNYVAVVAFDPEVVGGGGGQGGGMGNGSVMGGGGSGHGMGKLSLAVDFMVQGDAAYGGVNKYGPVIVPSLEFGR